MAVPSATNPAATYGATQVAVTATQVIGKTFPYNTIMVQNRGGASIYIGWDLNVTSANGIEIPPNATVNVDIWRDDVHGPDLYAVAPGGLQVSPNDTRWMAVR